MYEFASSSATLLTVYTAVMHTRRMNVIPEAELWNYDRTSFASLKFEVICSTPTDTQTDTQRHRYTQTTYATSVAIGHICALRDAMRPNDKTRMLA